MNSEYKNKFNEEHYDRIFLAVPKGMKQIIKDLASEKGMSVNKYVQHLVRLDQEGMFDTIQVADKHRDKIAGIKGNMHDGYTIIFTDGYTTHRRTKKDVREVIVRYCNKK